MAINSSIYNSILQSDPIQLWLSIRQFTFKGYPLWGQNIDKVIGKNMSKEKLHDLTLDILEKLKQDNIRDVRGVQITPISHDLVEVSVIDSNGAYNEFFSV